MRNYFHQSSQDSGVKLPLKWMAPESIKLGIFSEKSNVVSSEKAEEFAVDVIYNVQWLSCPLMHVSWCSILTDQRTVCHAWQLVGCVLYFILVQATCVCILIFSMLHL